MQSVTDNGNGGVTNYSYDATNEIASFGYPNSAAHSYSYDTRASVNHGLGLLFRIGIRHSERDMFGLATWDTPSE